MIRLENISKSYKLRKRGGGMGDALKSLVSRHFELVKAVDGLSFNVGKGEIIGYIGPNGAGKSTTIKIMCGVLRPDAGECVINGYTPWKKRVEYVRGIGVVFGQRSQLWWDVPVIDSFQLLRDIYKLSPIAYKRSLDRLTEALDIGQALRTPARQLSLGNRMRCEFAASLLHEPEILFLDEPTIGLDAISKLAVRQFIRDENQGRGLTVILTTHDMHDIEALTERVILIGGGHILHDGTLSDIKQKYAQKENAEIEETIAAMYRMLDGRGSGS